MDSYKRKPVMSKEYRRIVTGRVEQVLMTVRPPVMTDDKHPGHAERCEERGAIDAAGNMAIDLLVDVRRISDALEILASAPK